MTCSRETCKHYSLLYFDHCSKLSATVEDGADCEQYEVNQTDNKKETAR